MRFLEMPRWERFCRQLQGDAQLWLLMMACLTIYRVAMIVAFRERLLDEGVSWNFTASLLVGLRFDAMACTYWLLPSIVASVVCGYWNFERAANILRQILGGVFLVVTPMLCCLSIEFFREFNDIFNQFLFNAWYDNKPALLSTAVEQHHLIQHLLICAVLISAGFTLRNWLCREPFLADETVLKCTSTRRSRWATVLCVAALVVIGVRGSAGRAPVGPGKSAVTPDALCNKAAINPYMALVYAAKIQLEVAGEGGLKLHLPDEDVVAAAQLLFPEKPIVSDLDQYFVRVAQGPKNGPPKHIFMIGMESYDAWPLLDKYRSLGCTENLRQLGEEGLHVKAFLPSDEYSMRFANTVITGLPYAGIQTNWQRESQRPFPSSLPETMRKLGYRTRYFCGAPLDWQNCQHFCPSQGFDETYGSLDIVQGTGAVPNLWAAPDELLWKFIASKIKDDEPSFTFVFSSSYHVPYDIDLEKANCPLKEVPADLRADWHVPDDLFIRKYGHLWYADHQLGKFVRKMEQEITRPLFAITGDHFGRTFMNGHPTLYEKSCVPLVLYGKEVLAGIKLPEGVAGGHVDIAPTILELTAPKGFRYHAFGQNLLVPQERFFGYGAGKIIGHDFMVEVDKPEVLHEIPGRPLPPMTPDIADLTARYRAARGLSWWRHKRGTDLPTELIVQHQQRRNELEQLARQPKHEILEQATRPATPLR